MASIKNQSHNRISLRKLKKYIGKLVVTFENGPCYIGKLNSDARQLLMELPKEFSF